MQNCESKKLVYIVEQPISLDIDALEHPNTRTNSKKMQN